MLLTIVVLMQSNVVVAVAQEYEGEEVYVSYETNSYLENDRYVYLLMPDDPEWIEMVDYSEKVTACRIPETVLESLSNEQLLQAIIDFPLLSGIFTFSSLKEGTEHLEKVCDAYAELLRRTGAKDILLDEIFFRNNKGRSVITAEEEIILDTLVALTIYQEGFCESLSFEEAELLADASTLVEIKEEAYALDGVVTPNKTFVPCEVRTCYHTVEGYHKAMDAQIEMQFGVELVYEGTCTYNCHSYAWYKQSPYNRYWMQDPTPYTKDGSYSRVVSGNLNTSAASAIPGDIVLYGSISHSAVLEGSISGEPIATRTLISKWGSTGVFRHRATQVPSSYDTNTISMWHR